MQSAVIIGGGLGGLVTGALLAREGWRVTVLEKNSVAGGGLQSFSRGGVSFDTGMHILGGMRHGGSVNRILRYLGIDRQIKLVDVDDDCMDEVTYGSDGMTYRLPSGRERYVAALSRYFPDEATGIRAYVDEMYATADSVDLFNLRRSTTLTPRSGRFVMAADEFIASHLRSPRLRDLAAYINPLYDGVAGHTPAYIHSLLNVLYINGPSRPAGSSRQLAAALCGVITSCGGQVLTGCPVSRIDVSGRHVTAVHTADGSCHTATHCIAAIHPCEMLRLLTPGAVPKAYASRLQSIPCTSSSFSLFIKLKPERVPYINHTCYYQSDYGQTWHHAKFDDSWPRGMMYMTPPAANPGTWADRMTVNCLMDFAAVERWADTSSGSRGAGYDAWKKAMTQRVLDLLERARPGIGDAIDRVWSASPLTIRDYYHTERGSIYGYRKDCRDMMLSQLPVVTKIDNLLLTGQNINLHGICGVPLTAVNTVEAILGTNHIVDKINRMCPAGHNHNDR